MGAIVVKLKAFAGLTGVDIERDRTHKVPDSTVVSIDVVQGSDQVSQRVGKYVDSNLVFTLDIQVRAVAGQKATSVVNDACLNVVKALAPKTDNTLGVAGASNMMEIGPSDINREFGDFPAYGVTMEWVIAYRRDEDNPELFTP